MIRLYEIRYEPFSIFEPDKDKLHRMTEAQKQIQKLPKARLVDCGFSLYDDKATAEKAVSILHSFGFRAEVTREMQVPEEEEQEEEEED